MRTTMDTLNQVADRMLADDEWSAAELKAVEDALDAIAAIKLALQDHYHRKLLDKTDTIAAAERIIAPLYGKDSL